MFRQWNPKIGLASLFGVWVAIAAIGPWSSRLHAEEATTAAESPVTTPPARVLMVPGDLAREQFAAMVASRTDWLEIRWDDRSGMGGPIVTDAAMKAIAACPELQVLSLPFSQLLQVPQTSIAALGRCPDLRHIDLSGGLLDDSTVLAITGGCRKIEVFRWGLSETISVPDEPAGRSWLSGAGLAGFAGCRDLRELKIRQMAPGLDHEPLIRIAASCPRLQALQLETPGEIPPDSRINDQSLAALARCAELRELRLDVHGEVGDAPLVALAEGGPKLEVLEVRGAARIGDASLLALASCGKLRELAFPAAERITDAGLAKAASWPELRDLDLSAATALSDGGLAVWGERPHHVRKLHWNAARGVTDAGLSALLRNLGMESLQLDDGREIAVRPAVELRLNAANRLTDASLIAFIHSNGRVTRIALNASPHFTDAGVKALADGIGQYPGVSLLGLELAAAPRLTDESLRVVAGIGNALDTLNFASARSISDEGLRALWACRRLQRLDLSSARGITLDALRSYTDQARKNGLYDFKKPRPADGPPEDIF